jgi:proteasome lid subunit RPN8/RPN11
MTRWSSAAGFVQSLTGMRTPDVFNPYADICATYDLSNAPAIRRKNLELVLAAALSGGIDALWIAQDLGRNGGRRTGLALTDEPNLDALAARWQLKGVKRATSGSIVREATAGYAWQVLKHEERKVFLWNIFPFHSHPAGQPLRNRGHSRAEAASSLPFLLWLADTFRPRKVVALGRVAEATLKKQGITCDAVRHPGRGGGPRFLRDMAALNS